VNYCISREGDLSEQDMSITRYNNRSDVGAKKEDMADLDEDSKSKCKTLS
jgi:hypothetical protein